MLDEKGLSPLVASIVLLTVTLAVGAVVAATIAGSPRPTLPLSTAVHVTDGGWLNLSQDDQHIKVSVEWGEKLRDAVTVDADNEYDASASDLQLVVNGAKTDLTNTTVISYGEAVVYKGTQMDTTTNTWDLACNDGFEGNLPSALSSGNMVKLIWKPRKLTLLEYIVQ